MGNSKTTKKCACGDKCNCGSKCSCDNKTCAKCGNVFSICFLTGVLVAVLVALTFAISFTVIFNYELKHKYGLQFSGQFAKELKDFQDNAILDIEAGAVIDFYESGQTGFLYVSSDDCQYCESFGERLTSIASEAGILANVFHYNYPKSDASVYDDYVSEITLNGEEAPVLLYVRDGRIYDRLDETNGGTGIFNFIAKYK